MKTTSNWVKWSNTSQNCSLSGKTFLKVLHFLMKCHKNFNCESFHYIWKTVFSFHYEDIHWFGLKKILPYSWIPLSHIYNCSLEVSSCRSILLDYLKLWLNKDLKHMIAEVFIFLLCIQYLYIVFMNESSEAQVMQQIRLIPRWNSSVKKGDSCRLDIYRKHVQWKGNTWYMKTIYNITESLKKTILTQS